MSWNIPNKRCSEFMSRRRVLSCQAATLDNGRGGPFFDDQPNSTGLLTSPEPFIPDERFSLDLLLYLLKGAIAGKKRQIRWRNNEITNAHDCRLDT